jgi:hypothetical protein
VVHFRSGLRALKSEASRFSTLALTLGSYDLGAANLARAAHDFVRNRGNRAVKCWIAERPFIPQIEKSLRPTEHVPRGTDVSFADGWHPGLNGPEQRACPQPDPPTPCHQTAGLRLRLHLDSGRTVALDLRAHPHLDFGYAVTSHSSQGQTADRVLVHIDVERAGEQLVNRRLAYVAISRGRYDAQIYTNDKAADMERPCQVSLFCSIFPSLQHGRWPCSSTRSSAAVESPRFAPRRSPP